MMRKVLLKPEVEVKRLKIACKTKDRVCKVIIDSGSTDNLVSTEMVEKLELETTAHPNHIKSHGCRKDTR
jgi:hypothetical protein